MHAKQLRTTMAVAITISAKTKSLSVKTSWQYNKVPNEIYPTFICLLLTPFIIIINLSLDSPFIKINQLHNAKILEKELYETIDPVEKIESCHQHMVIPNMAGGDDWAQSLTDICLTFIAK